MGSELGGAREDRRQRLKELLSRAEATRPAPLSYEQERLWFLEQLAPGTSRYNVPVALRVRGMLDPDALDRALRAVIRRHAALRTVFPAAKGVPVQLVRPTAEVRIERRDLSAEPDPQDWARGAVAEEAGRPFPLDRGPLLRALLLRLGDVDHVLLLTLHHIVCDGGSLAILLHDLHVHYAAGGTASEDALPRMALQYADYAVRQRARLRGEALDRELAYWRSRLDGIPASLDLPFDRPRPAAGPPDGGFLATRLRGPLVDQLRALAAG
ncbi:MAG TPA: condensation domain-containing protein, partial [Candidatus Dormibacteraeota bacterium]